MKDKLDTDRAVIEAKRDMVANGERVATEHLKRLAYAYLQKQVEIIFDTGVKPDLDKMLSQKIRSRVQEKISEAASAMIARRTETFIRRAEKKLSEV